MSNERYQLLERLAARIAEVCAVDTRVQHVSVTVRKLHPPVRAMVDHVAVLDRAVTPRPVTVRAYLGRRVEPRGPAGVPAARRRRASPRPPGSTVVAVSRVYETDPIGPGAARLPERRRRRRHRRSRRARCSRSASASRPRPQRVRGERWGPRTLDVDVLLFGDEQVDEPDLVIPHPRLARA